MTWPNWNHISPTSLDFPENFGLPFPETKTLPFGGKSVLWPRESRANLTRLGFSDSRNRSKWKMHLLAPICFITSILAGKLKHPQKTHTLNPPEVSWGHDVPSSKKVIFSCFVLVEIPTKSTSFNSELMNSRFILLHQTFRFIQCESIFVVHDTRPFTKRSWKCWIDIMFTSFWPEQNGP